MRHLKGLLRKKEDKSPSSTDEGGDDAPITPTEEINTEPPNGAQEKETEHKHKHKHKAGKTAKSGDTENAEKEHKHKHHSAKRSRSHELARGSPDEAVHSPLRVCEPVKTSGHCVSESESGRVVRPPIVSVKKSQSTSCNLSAEALAAAGIRVPIASDAATNIVVESRGRQRSGAFYDTDLPSIADRGGCTVKDLPQPSTSLKVTTGLSSVPEGVSWSLRFAIGVADTIGRREKMEDTFAVIGQFGMPMRDLFLVCDGHNGPDASNAVKKMLPTAFLKALGEDEGNVEKAFKDAFAKVNEQLRTEKVPGGTTVTAIFADIDAAYVAHVGDSRAVLVKGNKSTALTMDHRPNNASEAEAVTSRGGTISHVGNDLRVNKILAVTRALGDPEVSSVISAVPDVRRFTFDFEPDSALVVACDGLWDFLSEQDVADVIDTFKDPLSAAQELRNLAYQSGSKDNITVVVVRAST